jgi:Domain of unknown function (DUF4164)
MTHSPRLDGALTRLSTALNALEAAVARRLEDEYSSADLEEELAIMQDDRSRLALELDTALARAGTLDKTRQDVIARLERASASVAVVLGDAQRADE